jgi:hypothetical protein
LVPIAIFSTLGSLIPSPPLFWGEDIVSQFSGWKFLELDFPPC